MNNDFEDDLGLAETIKEINSVKDSILKADSEKRLNDLSKRLKNLRKEVKIYCQYKDYDYKKVKKYYYL